MQGNENSPIGHLQACVPGLKCIQPDEDSRCMGVLYKHGPKHDLDLVQEDLSYEVKMTWDRREETLLSTRMPWKR